MAHYLQYVKCYRLKLRNHNDPCLTHALSLGLYKIRISFPDVINFVYSVNLVADSAVFSINMFCCSVTKIFLPGFHNPYGNVFHLLLVFSIIEFFYYFQR
jgi:hypothetical protein